MCIHYKITEVEKDAISEAESIKRQMANALINTMYNMFPDPKFAEILYSILYNKIRVIIKGNDIWHSCVQAYTEAHEIMTILARKESYYDHNVCEV